MSSRHRKHDPIRQSVHVDCTAEDAFRLFTEGFAEWWPLALYSMTGAEATECEMEPWQGGRVFERTRAGEEHDWGSVVDWDPPKHLRLSWYPGGREDGSETLDVEFAAEPHGTRVTVIHTGWEIAGVATCSLQRCGAGMWSSVLENCFSAFVSEQMLVVA